MIVSVQIEVAMQRPTQKSTNIKLHNSSSLLALLKPNKKGVNSSATRTTLWLSQITGR